MRLNGSAKQGALFLMFMPGQSPLLEALIERAKAGNGYVRGVLSTVSAKGKGIIAIDGQVVNAGDPIHAYSRQVLVPANVPRGEGASSTFG